MAQAFCLAHARNARATHPPLVFGLASLTEDPDMTHNALRIAFAGFAIAALAAITLSPGAPLPVAQASDPSVPPASQVFHANDGRAEGNARDLTY